jgi:hypothetical protein
MKPTPDELRNVIQMMTDDELETLLAVFRLGLMVLAEEKTRAATVPDEGT